MDEILTRLNRRLSSLKSQAAEVEAAIRIVCEELGVDPAEAIQSDMRSENGLASMPASTTSLVGLKIREAAKSILAEQPAGQWVTYQTVAELACKRGYRAHDPERPPEKIADSFYHTMKKFPPVFESDGSKFRLRR